MLRKKCSTCKESLPRRDFCSWKAGPDGLSYKCKRCSKQLAKEYRQQVRSIGLEPLGLHSCSRCKITKPVSFFGRDRYRLIGIKSACKECIAQQMEDRRVRVLTYYSHESLPICKCCSLADLRFLTIDHINNDGAEHRRQFGGNIYYTLDKKHPSGFQVLCFNCNSVKYLYGACGGH